MKLSLNYFQLKYDDGVHYIWAYTQKKVLFDYSLGGYSHRERWARTRRCLLMSTGARKVKEDSMKRCYSHRERFFIYGCITRIFSVKIRLRHAILELRYRNETRLPWFFMKVRPRDPSCEAWYTHMDALCWYVSVSTTRRKSWWTHWVPFEPLGFIFCKS
jgi:hypothetical protein